MALTVIFAIVGGLLAATIYEWIRRPRLDIRLVPEINIIRSRKGSLVASRHIRVTNGELCRFLGRFIRRSDAHSCYAWVMFFDLASREIRYAMVDWIPVHHHPSPDFKLPSWRLLPLPKVWKIPKVWELPRRVLRERRRVLRERMLEDEFMPSMPRPREGKGRFIDIGSGGAADIAIVEEAKFAYYDALSQELPVGKYVLKIEVGGSGLRHIRKWFMLEHKGQARHRVGLADRIILRESKKKELQQLPL